MITVSEGYNDRTVSRKLPWACAIEQINQSCCKSDQTWLAGYILYHGIALPPATWHLARVVFIPK